MWKKYITRNPVDQYGLNDDFTWADQLVQYLILNLRYRDYIHP